MAWSPGSWRKLEARQQPVYDDPAALAAAERALAAQPPLVAPAEVDALKAALAKAQGGRAFLLQAGDCAERFDRPSSAVADDLRLIGAMADAIAAASGLPVIAVGRIAGQFAKPRSEALERRGGAALPAWRGDLVNDAAFDAESRRPDPARMIEGYERAAATLALARRQAPSLHSGHEALLLPFEQALVRRDPATGRYYSGSAHLPWIGERTRFPGSAHVELARGLANPIGVKCGPTLEADTLLRLLDRLDPAREPGRMVLIARMGAARIGETLPPLMRAVRGSGRPVLWVCDPMHGNTIRDADGTKARPLAAIVAETDLFFEIAAGESVFGGGVHVETTIGDAVECAASPGAPTARAPCDPRLNAGQAVALARRAGSAAAAKAPLALAAG